MSGGPSLAWQQQQKIFDAMLWWAVGRGKVPEASGYAAPVPEALCYLSGGSYWARLPRCHAPPSSHTFPAPRGQQEAQAHLCRLTFGQPFLFCPEFSDLWKGLGASTLTVYLQRRLVESADFKVQHSFLDRAVS